MLKQSLIALIFLITSAQLYGRDIASSSHSKTGMALKYLSTSKVKGTLYGWRHVSYYTGGAFIGGEGFTGQLGRTSDIGTFSYGGVVAGYGRKLGKSLDLILGVLAGGGGGKVLGEKSFSGGGVVIEPSLYFNFKTNNVVHFNIGASYLLMTGNTDFTGYTIGGRVDFSMF